MMRTVLCCAVYDSCAQWYAHTCEQFLKSCVCLGLAFGVFLCLSSERPFCSCVGGYPLPQNFLMEFVTRAQQQLRWATVWPMATTHMGRILGVPLLGGGELGPQSPSNTMWPRSRPTCMPSFDLICPTVWPQYTNVTDRTDRQTETQTGQRSDSIWQIVLCQCQCQCQ